MAWTTLAALAWFFAQGSRAEAASRDAREKTARTACLAGDYTKGVTILSELFVESSDANYIYNQGRCLEQNARYEEAVARFQEYLRVGRKLSRGDKAETEKHIATCEAMLAKRAMPDHGAANPVPPTTAETALAQLPAAAVTPDSHQTATAVIAETQPARSPGAALRTAGLVVAGVGGAALIAGVLLNLKVNAMADDFRTFNGYTDAKESDRKTYETLGWVGYGVGGACVATGALLYVLGRRAGKPATVTVLAPSFSSGGVAATLSGRF